MKRISSYIVLFLSLLSIQKGSAQLLDEVISLQKPEQTVQGHLQALERNANIQFTYSPNQIDINKIVGLKQSKQKLKDHLNDILLDQEVRFVVSAFDERRIIIAKKIKKKKTIVRGLVLDEVSGEPLIGVCIQNITSNSLSYTDDDGYFRIAILDTVELVKFSLIGFQELVKEIKADDSKLLKLTMNTSNVIPTVLITGEEIRTYAGTPGPEPLIIRNISSHTNFLGDNNIIEELKTLPAVQSGNEGQIGLHVRGGGHDQNLVLFEGTPLYVSDHTAGISSIFVQDAIGDVLFFADSFPAKYGGRLSSIVDIRLANGSLDSIKGSLNASITGANFHTSGPLNPKMAYSVSGRLSWIDLYIDPILQKSFNYNNSDLNYYDLSAKVNYKINPSSTITFSGYTGKDNLLLERSSIDSTDSKSILLEDLNQVRWSNTMLAVNIKSILSDKWIMKAHFSGLSYKHNSRGRYGFTETDLFTNTVINNRNLDILSFSQINDINSYIDFNYFPTEKTAFNFGGGRLIHKYTPTIRQSTITTFDEPDVFVNGDSSIISNEQYLYGELVSNPFKTLDITAGVRISSYDVREKKYSFTEPRLSFVWKPNLNHFVSLSYNKMVQYLHLLVNPSAGLPADLWVPSTENIEPEFADHVSLGYAYGTKDFRVSLLGYYKKYDQLLEYSNAFDLFFSVLNEGDFVPVFNSSNEWERRVSTGAGRALGAEFYIVKNIKRAKVRLGYSYSESNRTFPNINGGQSFPYTFDRTHDINASLSIPFGKSWNFASKWIYGTGNTFTLAIEQLKSPSGIIILRASGRNNYRHLPFHHLDLNINKLLKFEKFSCRISLGVYNAYNRLNPLYAFIYNDPSSNSLILRQVSIFPVIPHLSFKTSW